jgi:hypothetical protein
MGMNEEGILVNSQLPYFFPNLLEMSIKKSGGSTYFCIKYFYEFSLKIYIDL